MKSTKNKKIGNLGEDISIKFLLNKGYKIIDRNWEILPYGEIDIIAEKNNILFFFEIKSTSSKNDKYSPKHHLTNKKLKNFEHASKKYILINKIRDKEYKIQAIIVYINIKEKKASIELLKNLLF